jgi:streptomycin 6-kinase
VTPRPRVFSHSSWRGCRQVPRPRACRRRRSGAAGSLVEAAHGVYDRLAATQRHERLLHGDLHHGNVVFDRERGWLVIDPKGVVAELEFELGAALRNPWDRPALFTDPGVIRRRARTLADGLRLDLDCPYLTLAERLRSV